ncbi:MAG: beta-propeller fold lactonase family protein, partial [Algicola sp.]|nr:beta-propeller fold lactonase family protein [Algicola sp.]
MKHNLTYICLLLLLTACTQKPVETLAQSTYSSPIALSSDNLLVWSVNPDSDSVSVVRTDTLEMITQIAVGDEPRSVALSADNKFAYVANAADNSVTVIKIANAPPAGFSALSNQVITTGSEPNAVIYSPDGRRVFVSNANQNTITVIDANDHSIVGAIDLKNSLCNVVDTNRHFHPQAMAVTQDSKHLYVTRFFSFTHATGVQKDDHGKEGIVCRLDINTRSSDIAHYKPVRAIHLNATDSGMKDAKGNKTAAFPNQLQNIVIRNGHAYLPNIGASPTGPQRFNVNTQAYVNRIDGIGGAEVDGHNINLHHGGQQPESGKPELYFANPWGIAFT